MLDNLSQEIFRNSPTFRGQMSAAFTVVAVARWTAASATVIGVDKLEEAGIATAEQLIARKFASTEAAFLRRALATQGIYLDENVGQTQMMIAGSPAGESASKEGITKLINQMLASPGSTWTWSVSDWMAGQDTAAEEIATHLNTMFAAMVVAPAGVAATIQAAVAELPVSRPRMP